MTAQPSSKNSELGFLTANDRKGYPFYHTNIEHKVSPDTQNLLEKYSHIPREQQSEHIHQIRDRLFDIRAYPCTGMGSWLVPQVCRMPVYPEVLQRAKDGATVMDIGTFVGHDLRRLVFDGAPSDQLYGVDIVNHFDVGYDFFRDRDQWKGHFIEADFSASTTPALAALKGNVDVIIISQVLHLWNWDGQVQHARTLATEFSKLGTMIVGNQLGNMQATEYKKEELSTVTFLHDPESFARMWNEVGDATGTKWETQSWLRTWSEMGWDANDTSWMGMNEVYLLVFAVTRVA